MSPRSAVQTSEGSRFYDLYATCDGLTYGVEVKTSFLADPKLVKAQIFKDLLVVLSSAAGKPLLSPAGQPIYSVIYLGYSGDMGPEWKSAELALYLEAFGIPNRIWGGVSKWK